MSYTGYERSGTSCLQEVEAFCRHLTEGGTFSTSSIPTLAQVERFLTDAHDQIAVWLQDYGYDSAQTDTDVLGALQIYNAYGAAALVEITQPSVSWEPREGNRYSLFQKKFEEVKGLIQSRGFGLLGGVKSVELSRDLSAGGISVSDKEVIETDTDHPDYWFTRDLHRHPGEVSKELQAEE